MADRTLPSTTSDDGAASTEYGLLLALVAGAVIAAATLVGNGVSGTMSRACDAVAGAHGHAGTPSGGGGGLATAPGLRRRC